MENNIKPPRLILNAVSALRDLKATLDACGTSDVDLKTYAENAADALHAAADSLFVLGYGEAAFTLRRSSEICTGIAALTLGSITKIDGERILARSDYREAMFKTMAAVASDLAEAEIREAYESTPDDNGLFKPVRAYLKRS